MSFLHRYQIPEVVDQSRRLGRHVHHDSRSAAYPADLAPKLITTHHQSYGLPLNQGSVGSCTAEALTGALNTDPDYVAGTPPRTQDDAYALYSQEVALEGGTYPPDDPGGSGLMVCKAAKNAGLISNYFHAFLPGDALLALVLRPGIFGVNWYDSFDTPDENGVVSIAPGASVRGGHEILAYGVDLEKEQVLFWNSWGPEYGIGGKFSMSFGTVLRLLLEGGDMVFPVK